MLAGAPTVARIVRALDAGLARTDPPDPCERAEALRHEVKLSNQMASAAWHLQSRHEKLAATPTSANDYQQVLYEYLQAEALYTGIVAGAMKVGRTAVGTPGDGSDA